MQRGSDGRGAAALPSAPPTRKPPAKKPPKPKKAPAKKKVAKLKAPAMKKPAKMAPAAAREKALAKVMSGLMLAKVETSTPRKYKPAKKKTPRQPDSLTRRLEHAPEL